MFTHVMNLMMDAAIFRAGTTGGEPERARPKKAKAARRLSGSAAEHAGGNRAPATYQIYAAAFKTAVYGG